MPVAHGSTSSFPPGDELPGSGESLSTPTTLTCTSAQAARIWLRFAPLLAARGSMRLWDPELRAYRARAQRFTRRLPSLPAAVPLYLRGRTRVLALDFDARHGSREAVTDDVDRCVGWIVECGGRVVVDRSPSGGQHVLVPLPIGITLGRDEIEPIIRLLAERLPSLDLTPMLNSATGCLTPPGSATRDGGHRVLVGSLDDAVDAFTVRSDSRFLARLTELLGGIRPHRATAPDTTTTSRAPRTPRATGSRAPRAVRAPHADLWEGDGERARLRAQVRLRSPLPDAVRRFAVHGTDPGDRRWHTRRGRLDRSRARQSVLAAAVLRGYSLTDIHTHLPAAGGNWAGFWSAYDRYGRGARDALRRDWARACDWAASNAPEFLSFAHKTLELTGGWRGDPARTRNQTAWLAAATVWVDAQWPRSPRRASILAVLQALAHASVVAGAVVRGVPVVEVGGRSLSIMAGCLPETTVWQVLRDLRDLPGSPILRTRQAAGQLADQYVLVTPRINERRVRPDRIHIDRTRVEPVHEAWSVLGLHCRRLYELIAHHGLTIPADVIAAAGMSRSAGYAALDTLTTAGLLTHQRGRITPGPIRLDDIAVAHGLAHTRHERIARHRHQRALWHDWLNTRFGLHTEPPVESQDAGASERDQPISTVRGPTPPGKCLPAAASSSPETAIADHTESGRAHAARDRRAHSPALRT